MATGGIALREGAPADAMDLARLVTIASEGLTEYLWAAMVEPGIAPLDFGAARAARGEGAFSWRNATMAEVGGVVAGGVVTRRVGDVAEPLDELPPMFRPLQALENRVPGSRYVAMLATYESFRRRGVARALLAEAVRAGAGAPGGVSLIVADRNAAARALYRATGFADVAQEPIIKEGWACRSDAWVLMVKR